MAQEEPLDLSLPKLVNLNQILSFTLNYSLQLDTVKRKSHLGKQLICKICDKTFDRPSLLLRHHRTHTGKNNDGVLCAVFYLTSTTSWGIQCACNFLVQLIEYLTKTHNFVLYSHYNVGEKPFLCKVCMKRFSTSSSLNTHFRIHTGQKPHECPFCGKRFTASSNLYYHRMTHSKVSYTLLFTVCLLVLRG